MSEPHLELRYAVIGFEGSMEDCPLFTNLVRTYFGAKLVEQRFRRQGLKTRIYDLSKEKAPGLNPYVEKRL